MDVYDLYVTNITRVYQNHHELATLLMDFINEGVKKENMEKELGLVIGVKIPKNNEPINKVRTNYGHICFEKHENH